MRWIWIEIPHARLYKLCTCGFKQLILFILTDLLSELPSSGLTTEVQCGFKSGLWLGHSRSVRIFLDEVFQYLGTLMKVTS